MGNLDTGLQVKEKTVKHRIWFLERSCKDIEISKSKKCINYTKNMGNTKNFAKTGKQRVEMEWRSSEHGE